MSNVQLNMNRLIVLLLVVTISLGACAGSTADDEAGTNDPREPAAPASLAGSWTLTKAMVDGNTLELPSQLPITIIDGSVQGNAGCNTFSGTIDSGDDGSLAIDSLVQTELACEHLDFEMSYTAALLAVDSWESTPDRIVFFTENTRLEYETPIDDRTATTPLQGTVWVLDTVYGPGEGPQRSASSIDPDGARVEIVFAQRTIEVRSRQCTNVILDMAIDERDREGSLEFTGQADGYECQGSESDALDLDLALAGLRDATGFALDQHRLTVFGDEGELLGFVVRS